MNNQNIYLQDLKGYISINREILSKLGLNEKPFLRTVYMLLVERTNWETGIVFFSSRFAQATLEIGQDKHKKIVEELCSLGLVEDLTKGKNGTTKLRVIHYSDVINGHKKELDTPVQIKTIEEQILKAEMELPTPVKEQPVFNIIKDKEAYELLQDENEELLNEYFKVRGGFTYKADALKYIRTKILSTNETFTDHCERVIKSLKNTEDEKIKNLL